MIKRLRSSQTVVTAALVGLLSFTIYLVTLAPTVLVGDDGELVAVAHVLGISHPTGYPLYLIIAKLFDLLPFGSSPVKIGVFSALSAAGAAAFIAYAVATISKSLPAGLLTGLVAAFNRPLWSEATHVEVYAFNSLIISLAITVFVIWHLRRDKKHLVYLALLVGLGLAHHRSAIFFTVPALLIALFSQRLPARYLWKVVAAGIIPLFAYLYLPLRAATRPQVRWGDLTQWDKFVTYILGREYFNLYAFKRPLSEISLIGKDMLLEFGSELTLGGGFLLVLGIIALFLQNRRFAILLLAGFALTALWGVGYRVEDWLPYIIPCYLVVGIWMGVGLEALAKTVRSSTNLRFPYGASILITLALVFVPVNLLQTNWSKSSHRGEWRAYDRVSAMLNQIPPEGIFITNRDTDFFIPMYQQVVEKKRLDLLILSVYGDYDSEIDNPTLAEQLTPLLKQYRRDEMVLSDDEKSLATLAIAVTTTEVFDWERPVFCAANLTTPPKDSRLRPLWSDFFKITRSYPNLTAPIPPHSQPIKFDNGLALVGAFIEPSSVSPGKPMRAILLWTLSQPLEKPPFILLRLRPVSKTTSADPTKMLLKYGAWLGEMKEPLPSAKSGQALRQEVWMICPTNAPSGLWELWIGVGANPESSISTKFVTQWSVELHNPPRK